MYGYLYYENECVEWLPDDVDSFQTLVFNAENLLQHTTRTQSIHTAHNTHTWGRVRLRRVTWDSYVRIPTFIARETSNNRFTILEPILPIASKRRMIRYLRVT